MSEAIYLQGIRALVAIDPDLAASVARWGNPPFWTHPPGLSGVVLSVLAQQVSLESARAAYERLEGGLGAIDAQALAAADEGALRQLGLTRQKASYLRGLALAIQRGRLDLAELDNMPDDQVREKLLAIRGIGPWTADCVLLFSLRRPDAWPTGDLALAKAAQEIKCLPVRPGWDELDAMAQAWRPWRAVAARILWHDYLQVRGRAVSA